MAVFDIKSQLYRDEGKKKSVYKDSRGFDTIGCGRLVDARMNAGLSDTEIDYLLDNDIRDRKTNLALSLPWYLALDSVRQGVLVNMAFQLGLTKLLEFHNTLGYMKAHEFDLAATEMLNSDWAKETPERAGRLAQQMQTGQWV